MRFQSKWTIVLAWLIPLLVYWGTILLLPYWRKHFDLIQTGHAVFTILQLMIPVAAIVLTAYFPDDEPEGRVRPLNSERFWASFVCVLVYDALMLSFFFLYVVWPDYSAAETDAEKFESKLDMFVKIGMVLSLVPATPLKFLFTRRKKSKEAKNG